MFDHSHRLGVLGPIPFIETYLPCSESPGMSLRLLKFSGGSVDDYAICRSC
jgi:hypothetical protein